MGITNKTVLVWLFALAPLAPDVGVTNLSPFNDVRRGLPTMQEASIRPRVA